MSIFIGWLACSIAAGIFASNRGRSGFGWFFLSFLITPLLGLVFIAVSKDLSKSNAPTQPGPETHVKCPACAEFVLPEASMCKHCGTALVPSATPAQVQQRQVKEAQAQKTINLIMGAVAVLGLFAAVGVIRNLAGN